MEERLEGGCKKRGGMGNSTATRRRVSQIDSKIYGVRREKREEGFSHERRDYIANNSKARDSL